MCSSPSPPAISSAASCSKTTARSLRARNAYDKAEFFGSTDERFRPVFISNAPDGTLMVVDFYRGVIQDRASTTLYLKDYIQKRKLDAPTGVGRGRVYRIVHECVQRDHDPAAALARNAGAARGGVVPPERLVARHGPAAARRTQRREGRPGAQGACDRHRAGSHAREGALGPRRHRHHRHRNRHQSVGGCFARRPHVRRAHRRAVAGRGGQSGSGRRSETDRRSGLAGARAGRGVAGRDGHGTERDGARVAAAEAWRTIRSRRTRR